MRLLLDTHVWIWSLLDPDRLSRKAVRVLEDPSSELWLSPISLWELSVLVERGRLTLEEPIDEWIARAFDVAPMREAPLTHEIALESARVSLPHRDPADRFLVATARVLDLSLATADERILSARPVTVLAAG